MCIIDAMNNVTANKKLHVKHEEREKELWEEHVQLAIDVQLLNKKWKLSSTVVDPLCFLSNVFIAYVMVNDYFVTLMVWGTDSCQLLKQKLAKILDFESFMESTSIQLFLNSACQNFFKKYFQWK